MFKISLGVTPSQHIAVEAVLEDYGAISISLHDAEDDAVFVHEVNEIPLWNNIRLTALFEDEIDTVSLQNTLEKILAHPIEISKRTFHNQDWLNTWKQDFHPVQFGERLWICPSWCSMLDPFAINVQLDPGIAFGTGTHPTTALCLEWLESHPPIGKQVVDFGCGSGILSMASYYLGAKTIVAIDHDPQATQATCANIKRNQIPKHIIKVVTASSLDVTSNDLILANVLFQPLIELEREFAKSLLPAGKIIISGILQQQLTALEQKFSAHFRVDEIYPKKEWLLVEATRR